MGKDVYHGARVSVKLNFGPCVKRHTTPNKKLEYSYSLSVFPKCRVCTAVRAIILRFILSHKGTNESGHVISNNVVFC